MDVGIEDVENILLVEDNPGDIRLIEEAFKASSLDPTIQTATTRDEALDMLCQQGEYGGSARPDLVFLDWNLTKYSGQEVLQVMKTSEPEIPVVVMTGSKQGIERIESSAPAADEYIEKQTDPQKYLDILRSCEAEQ